MMPKIIKTAAIFAFAAMALPSHAEEDCRLKRAALLDMIPSDAGVVVPASIGDHPVKMVVDTGGYMTMFTEAKAKELGLQIGVEPSSGLMMYGGLQIKRQIKVGDFTLGRMKAPPLIFPLLPDGFLPPDVDGLLAPDLIANFDVDFDFANGKLSLFSPHPCDGKAGWWATPDQVTQIPITREEDRVHISMHVMLDGEDVKALIDTGASHSVMSWETARRLFDIKDDDPRLSKAPQINKATNTKRFPFKKMSFGNVEVFNPDIILVPDREAQMGSSGPKLILGLSVLHQLHLLIAYREKNLYLTAASTHR